MSPIRARSLRALPLLLLLAVTPGFAEEVTIVYTGETHAMVSPCKCVLSQDGGVARRATMLDSISRNGLTPTLILDAGGQFGGSAYDEYTQGEAVDMARTRTHLRACEMMGYDAYAISDEELQWGLEFLRDAGELGGAPFLSANLSDEALQAAGGERYLLTELGSLTVGITAATTQDRYALPSPLLDPLIDVGDPVEGLRQVVADIRDKVDLVVVLSPLGTDVTRLAATQVEGVDIFLNAHRRLPGSYIDRVNGALVCEFNMEARSLSRLDLVVEDGVIAESRLREIPLDPSVSDAPELAALVAEFEDSVESTPGARVTVDYYTAWGCVFCTELEPELAEALQMFGPGEADVRRWYVSHWDAQAGELVSMFGPESIQEASRMLAVEQLHGVGLQSRYSELRAAQPAADPSVVMRTLGMDVAEVTQLAGSERIAEALFHHAERARRFGIQGTPTIYVNNLPLEYDSAIESDILLREFCWTLPEHLRGPDCVDVPECDRHSECRESGKIGVCEDPGDGVARCTYIDPPALEAIVLSSDDVRLGSSRDLLNDLSEVFVGLTSREVTYASPEGRALAQLADVRWLPAFFLPRGQMDARPNFPEFRNAFMELDDYYSILPMPQNTGIGGLDLTRQRQEGRLDLFYQVHNRNALQSVGSFLRLMERGSASEQFSLDLHPMLLNNQGSLAAEGGVAEIEEAARQRVVWREHPEAMIAYLDAREQAGNSSYWDTPLTTAGLDAASVRLSAESPGVLEALYRDALLAEELSFYGECVLLYAGQELADISTPASALRIADQIGLAPSSATIIYTGNTNGQLEACRCPGNPYGGLSRQASAIEELRELYPQAVLVDTGDMLADTADWTKFDFLQRAFGEMAYDAVSVGEQDFAHGEQILTALMDASPVPYFSANLTLGDHEPEARIIDRSGVRIGIIPLTSSRAFALTDDGTPAGVSIADPIVTAQEKSVSMRDECEILVALYHGPLEEARALATEAPLLDAIICGHEGSALQVAEQIGSTSIMAPGRNGEWVGAATFHLDEGGGVLGFENRLIPMDDAISEDPAVAPIIAEYQIAVQASQMEALRNAAQDADSEPEACGECHPAQLAQWQTTPHATADLTLRDEGREFDPECWDCHSSPALAADAARLPSVSCVACHRVGSVTDDGHEFVESPAPATCIECHTTAKSPHFRYEAYAPLVTH